MKYSEIKELIDSNAPEKGFVLAYTRKNIIFKEFYELRNVEEIFVGENVDIVEIHVFDDVKEYRIVSSESKRFEAGYVAHTAEFGIDDNLTYVQEIFLDLKKEDKADISADKIKVINHLSYTDEGMVYVDDYRLCMM